MLIRGLYGMVDSACGDPEEQLRLLVDEGVSPIQLRCKGWPRARVGELAARWMPRCTVILNDDATLAAELGVTAHLGDLDGPAIGPHGRSTHTLDQVRAAVDAAYIGFGPVFPTGSKLTPWTPRGLDLLRAAVEASPVPVVAIGGITPANLDGVRATGAAGWAVIAAIWNAADPRSVIRALR